MRIARVGDSPEEKAPALDRAGEGRYNAPLAEWRGQDEAECFLALHLTGCPGGVRSIAPRVETETKRCLREDLTGRGGLM